MIIDCHGHYTTTPPAVGEYRDKQKANVAKDPKFVKVGFHIGRFITAAVDTEKDCVNMDTLYNDLTSLPRLDSK